MKVDNNFEIFKKEIKTEILDAYYSDKRNFNIEITDEFLAWFIKTGTFFSETHLTIPQDIIVTKTTPGNCFHNSQVVSLQNEGIRYFEGIIRGVKNGKIIHHGFNISDDKIFDVSHLSNKKSFLDELKDETFFYFGVEIGNNIIKKTPDILEVKFLNNSLILNSYQESIAL